VNFSSWLEAKSPALFSSMKSMLSEEHVTEKVEAKSRELCLRLLTSLTASMHVETLKFLWPQTDLTPSTLLSPDPEDWIERLSLTSLTSKDACRFSRLTQKRWPSTKTFASNWSLAFAPTPQVPTYDRFAQRQACSRSARERRVFLKKT